jgi:uncharacterized protein (TIGR01777 family)
MKLILPGGTGLIGTMLANAFARDGHEVTVLGRRPAPTTRWRAIAWTPTALGAWATELEGADAVISLAGRSVNCRYTAENRREIMDSRVLSTRVVGEAIRRCRKPPRTWLQSSTATIYAHRYDAPNDEETGILDGPGFKAPDTWQFSVGVAKAWEKAANESVLPETRKVLLRTAIAMSPVGGGAFDILLRLVRSGLGGQAGNGRQFVSWIHEDDLVRAVYWLLAKDSIQGAVNIAAPNPVPNGEFMRTLREEWGARFGLPAPAWLLEIGARVIQTETELILKSRRVIPGILTKGGFTFDFPGWREAARDLCERWRKTQ